MRKIFKFVFLASLLQLTPCRVFAGEGDYFIGIAARTGSLWLSPLNFFALSRDLSYDWLSVQDDQGKINVSDGNPIGFKAVDLFRSFGIGVTFGYQPQFSPLGVYATVGYDFRQFKMQPDRFIDGYEKYMPSSWNAGVGIRFAPLLLFTPYAYNFTPFIDISTKYNKVFAGKAPYGNAKDQFGSGFNTRFALGLRGFDNDDNLKQ